MSCKNDEKEKKNNKDKTKEKIDYFVMHLRYLNEFKQNPRIEKTKKTKVLKEHAKKKKRNFGFSTK